MTTLEKLTGTTIAIRVPESLGDRLIAIARKENNRVSSVTRRLLTFAIEHEEAKRGETATKRRA